MTANEPDQGITNDNNTIADLRTAGTHPLMYSFPQGALIAFDTDLRYLAAGGHGLADVGLSREMLEGKTIFEAFPQETSAVLEPKYRATLTGSTPTWDIPYRGHIYSMRLAPVAAPSGAIVAGLGFTQDVTEARAAEQALRESEERNRLTFMHAPIGMAIVELDGGWRQVNAALTMLTEYTEDQLLRMTFQDITHPDDLELDLEQLNQLVAGVIGSYQMEKRYFTASGRIVWVLLSVALVRDEEGSPLYFISQIQDITETKREHQALQDLTAMLAHDLRTPAAVILGFSELIEGTTAADVAVVQAHAGRISAGARAMTSLLDNALTATALDSGQLVASPKEVPLRQAVATALRTIDLGAVSVDTSALDDDVTAWVDPVHLSQIITNLLTNAAKYGGEKVDVSATMSPGQVCLTIADNGHGVEPDFVPHLFDRFSRSPDARGGRQRGSGLGLYIVRDILTANGGSIRYSSARSGGAEFTVELCAAPDSASADSPHSPAA